MIEQHLSHPSVEQLFAFGQGRLVPPASAEVEAHISSCESCRQMLATVPDDSLIARLRSGACRAAATDESEASPASTMQHLTSLPSEALVPGAHDLVQIPSSLPGCLPPPQAPDELGRLGGYRLLEVLGHGGMGVVFRAEDVRLKRQVAVKVMRPEVATRQAFAERFRREAQSAAALEHENIVAVYHVGEENGVPYLVMPLLKGASLEERLRQRQPWSLGDVLRVGREVALGLAVAHAQGLIHRDIKPGNLWIDATGRVKILDFGLARPAAADVDLTGSGMVVGTPSYMAPEQLRGEPVDGRADLFALGCILYQMSTGMSPFRRFDLYATMAAVINDLPPPVRLLNPAIPAELSDLIMSLLAKDPVARPPCAEELARLFVSLEQQFTRQGVSLSQTLTAWPAAPSPSGTAARSQSPLPDTHSTSGSKAQPWRGITILAVAAALLLLLAGAFGALSVIRVETPEGTLIIQTEVPDVEVLVRQGGKEVVILDTRTKKEVKLAAGTYEVELLNGKESIKLSTDRFTLRRAGDKEIVRVYFEKRRRPGGWVKKPPLLRPRQWHMAAVLDGRIYVVGGSSGDSFLSAMEVYSPENDCWADSVPLHRVDSGTAGQRSQPGRFAGIAAVIGGKLFVIGGWCRYPAPGGRFHNLPADSVHIYDPKQNMWSGGAPIPIPVKPEIGGAPGSAHSVAAVIGRKLYLLTGQDGYGDCKHFHVYDADTNHWKALRQPTEFHVNGAGAVIDGKLYVVGGTSKIGQSVTRVLSVYDPATDTWDTKKSMPTPRQVLAAAAYRGKLYALGGQDAGGKPSAAVEIYDPRTDTWATGIPLTTPRQQFPAVVLGKTLYVLGGVIADPPGQTPSVEAIDLS